MKILPGDHGRRSSRKRYRSRMGVRDLDPRATYDVGEQVRHPELGIGTVTKVFAICIDVKFPRMASVRYPLLPPDAIDYSATRRFAVGENMLHPTFGAGTVKKVAGDRIEVVFPAGKKLLVHGKE
jgi:hypothetical protein